MKSRQLLIEATARLSAASVGSPRVDAELLLAHVLGIDRPALLTREVVDESYRARYADLVARRAEREPLQYLTGEAPFRFSTIAVGPGVFIPRPETELLVDAVLTDLCVRPMPVVVDLCAGSGALAIAIAHEVPGARVIAVERSESALRWLRRNTAGTAVEVIAADITDPQWLTELAGRVDAVVSNPPYVPTSTEVSAEVRHDPGEAVFAGTDGLALIPDVIAVAARLLARGGVLAMEHDETQADAVLELLERQGQWTDGADHHDLTGRPRYATAVRK